MHKIHENVNPTVITNHMGTVIYLIEHLCIDWTLSTPLTSRLPWLLKLLLCPLMFFTWPLLL